VLGLKEDLLLLSILNLSIGNTVLLRGIRMDSMKVLKCLFDTLTMKDRHRITVCVGSSDQGSEVPTPVESS
jgi:hypothetical protein